MKRIESFIKNILLRTLVLLNPIAKKTPLPVFNSKSNLLFIRLNRIGDALVTTPLLYEIKRQLGCKVYVLADKKNHFVFRNNTSVDEVIIYNKRIKDFFNINQIIKDKSIDAVIDLHDDVSTTVSFIIAISKSKYKFGLKKSNFTIYTHVVEKADPRTHHVIERVLSLSTLFNLQIDKKTISIRYSPTETENEIAATQLKLINPENNFLIGVNISAGSDARFWGVDNFKNLINMLKKYNAKTIIMCFERDLHFANQIVEQSDLYPVTNNFGIFASAVLKLDFLITPDTSVVHIASIKKIPVFGLYVKYNTEDAIWSPYNTEFEFIETEEPTLKNISFEQVQEKLIPFLEKHINVKRNS